MPSTRKKNVGRPTFERDLVKFKIGIDHSPTAISTTDHGGLLGLADDDHANYVHLSNPRTITTTHTFTAGQVIRDSSGEQLELGYNASVWGKITIDSAGDGTLQLTGTEWFFEGNSGTGAVDVTLNAPDGQNKTLRWKSSGVRRWSVFSTAAEDRLYFRAYTDGGTTIGETIIMDRATLHMGFGDAEPLDDVYLIIQDADHYQLRLAYDTNNYAQFLANASGDWVWDVTGEDIYPADPYSLNLGTHSNMFLSLRAAELNVSNLVAQQVIATIGGDVVVAPTTILIAPLGSTEANIVLNPGFEDGTHTPVTDFDYWTEVEVSGSITPDITTPHAGSYSVKIQQGVSDDTYIMSDAFTVTPGVTYHLTFYTKTDAGDNAGRYAVWDSTNSAWITSWTTTGITGTTWTQVSTSFQAPAGCLLAKVGFRSSTTATDWAYFDTVVVAQDDAYIYVAHSSLASGDTTILKGFDTAGTPSVEFIGITSTATAVTGGYRYTCDRNKDGSGQNNWGNGTAVVNTGAAGDGFIEVYSTQSLDGSAGPSLDMNVRASGTYNDWDLVLALGNLNSKYGVVGDTYGLGVGDYSSGKYVLVTDGGLSIHAAGDAVILDDSGLQLSRSTVDEGEDIDAVTWDDDGSASALSGLYFWDHGSFYSGELRNISDGSNHASMIITADSDNENNSSVILRAITRSALGAPDPVAAIVIGAASGSVADVTVSNAEMHIIHKGIVVGSSGYTPAQGDVMHTGEQIRINASGTELTVANLIFKTTESTYTSDTEFTTTDTSGNITSDFNTHVDPDATGALIRLDVWGNEAGQWVAIGTSSSSYQVTAFAPDGSDTKASNTGIVKLSGQEIYISRSVGTSNSVHYALYVIGYTV